MSEVGHLSSVEPAAPTNVPVATPERRRSLTLSRHLAFLGGFLLLVLVVVAVFAPVIAGHDPLVPQGRPFESPSRAHPLGTDDVGHDLFAQLLYGARVSLTIALLSATIAIGVGLTVALLAGYHRGKLEQVLMRVVDLTLAFPFLVLVIVLAAFFGRSLVTTVAVIGAVIWARPARILRSQVIKVREFQHVLAARAMGASSTRIIGRHILPRVAPLAAAQFVRAANISVLIEASLSFLGLGDTNRISWGTTLYFANSRNAILTDAWIWWILPPGLALTLAVLGFAFLGYAIEEWADPRLARAGTRPAIRRRRPGAVSLPPPAAMDDAVTLTVRNLTVHYETPSEPVRAVEGLSFQARRGQIVGLVGESGSGKSTLAMALLGLVRKPGRVVGGEVILNGRDLRALKRSQMAAVRGRDVALIPQSAMNALNPAYTVHYQVAEAAAQTREPVAANARAHELLDLVGIPAERRRAYPHELSGGMRQRVVIATAIANEPSLLVADEPVTGLDVITQARILRLLLDLRDRFGLTIVLISHDLPLVARVADDLLVMYAGRAVETGRTAAVTARPRHPYTRELLRAFPSLRGPKEPLASIPGDPPDLSNPPSGCPFHPRCPEAFEACPQLLPPLEERAPAHRDACLIGDRH